MAAGKRLENVGDSSFAILLAFCCMFNTKHNKITITITTTITVINRGPGGG